MTPLTSFLASSFLVEICSINCDFVICVAIGAPLIRDVATINGRFMKIRDFRHRRWRQPMGIALARLFVERIKVGRSGPRRPEANLLIASLEHADSWGVAPAGRAVGSAEAPRASGLHPAGAHPCPEGR